MEPDNSELSPTHLDRHGMRGASLRDRHSRGLTRLLAERRDLRGAHALADFIDDAVRWTI